MSVNDGAFSYSNFLQLAFITDETAQGDLEEKDFQRYSNFLQHNIITAVKNSQSDENSRRHLRAKRKLDKSRKDTNKEKAFQSTVTPSGFSFSSPTTSGLKNTATGSIFTFNAGMSLSPITTKASVDGLGDVGAQTSTSSDSLKNAETGSNSTLNAGMSLPPTTTKASADRVGGVSVQTSISPDILNAASAEFSISDGGGILMSTFHASFNCKTYSDVIVKLDGEEIPAHKVILSSRCKFFQAMLENDMKEKKDNVIELKEISATVAKEILRYIYTENVHPLPFEKALELYAAADRFDLQNLKHKCRDFIMNNFAVDNICEVIVVADLHSDFILARKSRDFFLKNIKLVLHLDKWAALEKETPQFCLNLLRNAITNDFFPV